MTITHNARRRRFPQCRNRRRATQSPAEIICGEHQVLARAAGSTSTLTITSADSNLCGDPCGWARWYPGPAFTVVVSTSPINCKHCNERTAAENHHRGVQHEQQNLPAERDRGDVP